MAEPPPIIRLVVIVVLAAAAEVCRTHTVCPLLIVPAAFVKLPVQPMEYSPPVMLMAAGTASPLIVALADVTSVLRATLVCAGKLKLSGSSSALVVDMKLNVEPPTVMVVVTLLAYVVALVWRRQS